MDEKSLTSINQAKEAALRVLLHNARGPFQGLPRTAGWGYPEPYTRDLMISALGFLATGNEELADALRRTLMALAANQTPLGHIPSLAHDPADRGASDTTPLFLFGLALYRESANEPDFLQAAAQKALKWMQYQRPDDMVMVAQLPTSDWRDEQWVIGFGLFVNTVVYAYLVLYGDLQSASQLRGLMNRLEVLGEEKNPHEHEASPERGRNLVAWVEAECEAMRERGELAVHLPPCLFPYILPHHADWRLRYQRYNRPGEYHNGGVWPFICGFYVAACVAAGRMELASRKLLALAELVKPWHENEVEWGFNEWIQAQTGRPCGRDWQTWSAAMYLYAAECVQRQATPFFGAIRDGQTGHSSSK